MNKLLIVLLLGLAGAPALAQVQPLGSSPPKPPALAPGLYVHVIDGLINISNKGGTQTFAAGQFGFTPTPVQPPMVVPKNPGLQFTLPQAFNPPPPQTGSTTPSKSNAVDCEVR
jgi:hypothetical protein